MSGPFQRRQAEGASVVGPALGVVETASVARGFVVADQMVKKSPVALVLARPVSSGKHVILVSGDVAEVEEAMAIARETAAAALVDRLLLPQVADGVLAALRETPAPPRDGDALGIFETATIASSLQAADSACKAAEIVLTELRLGDGLHGKAYFVLAGEHADVEAALVAAEHVTPAAMRLGRELIARPHEDFLSYLRR
ncbi:MAG TPA: BMC domain-containing protein [Polyangia bacterium]|nr:BMC domain-containing protein [Polyangia bacterium]